MHADARHVLLVVLRSYVKRVSRVGLMTFVLEIRRLHLHMLSGATGGFFVSFACH